MYSGTGVAGAYQSLGIAGIADGVFGTGYSIENRQELGLPRWLHPQLEPVLGERLYGGYARCSTAPVARPRSARTSLVLLGLTGNCNPDFNFGVIGVNTVWTPVKNLSFTADLSWSHLDQKYSGTIASPGLAAAAKPAAVYEMKDQNSVALLLRAQRNF